VRYVISGSKTISAEQAIGAESAAAAIAEFERVNGIPAEDGVVTHIDECPVGGGQ